MRFPAFILAVCLISGLAYAGPGRSPAVEDFVGIEVAEPEGALPQGKESLFNLEQDMQQLEKIEAEAYVTPKPTPKEHSMSEEKFEWNGTNTTAAIILSLLPLLSWFTAVSHLRRKASVESASNIEVLEKYRREREMRKKQQDDYKKAS
jgi:hypothetical protein